MSKQVMNQMVGPGFVALALGLVGGAAEAVTLYVANNGLDSSSCGALTSPCRSISQAIAKARPRDRVVVGPGKYGDLDGDGAFTRPGEEAAEVGFGCFCMIKVDKTLTIESRAGAAATVLDAGGAALSGIAIAADAVVFGKAKKGFTVTRADFVGGLRASSVHRVSVAGNLAVHTPGVVVIGGIGHVLRGNMATANSRGFRIGSGDSGGHLLVDNLAIANTQDGFLIQEVRDSRINGNVASVNGDEGFDGTDGASRLLLKGNVASGNRSLGFVFSDNEDLAVTGNAAYGNRVEGIRLNPIVSGVTISRNNIIGNAPDPQSGSFNCGFVNNTEGFVGAANNFWGASTGPGDDPADSWCNPGDGPTIVIPFGKKEFLIRTRPLF